VEGETFGFTITNGKVHVEAEEASERSFEFSVEPEEPRDGLILKISPKSVTVSIQVEATWEQKTYAHVLEGFILGGALGFFSFMLLAMAFVIYHHQKTKDHHPIIELEPEIEESRMTAATAKNLSRTVGRKAGIKLPASTHMRD